LHAKVGLLEKELAAGTDAGLRKRAKVCRPDFQPGIRSNLGAIQAAMRSVQDLPIAIDNSFRIVYYSLLIEQAIVCAVPYYLLPVMTIRCFLKSGCR
jgi:hypothetical protein